MTGPLGHVTRLAADVRPRRGDEITIMNEALTSPSGLLGNAQARLRTHSGQVSAFEDRHGCGAQVATPLRPEVPLDRAGLVKIAPDQRRGRNPGRHTAPVCGGR